MDLAVLNKGLRLGLLVGFTLGVWSQRADASASISPSPLDAGTAFVGQTAGPVDGTLTMSANARVDLSIGGCSGGGGTFTFQDDTDLNANPSVTVSLSYSPTARGQQNCTVTVYPAGNTSSVLGTFAIRGTGQAPATLTPNPAPTLDFTAIRWNDAAPVHTFSRNFNITNTGDVALSVTDVSISNTEWTITTGGTTGTINPGNAKTWTFQFNPAATGARSAVITFTSNTGGSPGTTTTFNVTGTGSNGIIGTTDSIPFGVVATGSQSAADITVSNTATGTRGNLGVTAASITVTAGTLGTGEASWFTFTGCGGGTSCGALGISTTTSALVGVKCAPPTGAADTSYQNASVTFTSDTDDAGGSPDRTTLLTCVAGKSTVETSSGSVLFAPTLVQTTTAPITLTVKNTGTIGTSFYLQPTGVNAIYFATSVVGETCGTGTGNQCPLGPGVMMTISVTFSPMLEGDVSAGLNIIATGTVPPQLALAGRGIDRHIKTELFVNAPETFRNPGTKATLIPVTVTNIGEYPLAVNQLAIGPDPIWTLAEAPDPFVVPGLGTHDVMVKFSPDMAGKAPDGNLVVVSDDRVTMNSVIILTGNGKDRNVQMSPSTVDIGDTGAGVPTRFSEVKMGQLLGIDNLDDQNDFTIREIRIMGDTVFNLDAKDTTALVALGSSKYDVIFVPPHIGEFTAVAQLYLDEDPVPQTSVEIHGRALYVDAHGGGGCSTGQGTGGGMLVLLGAFLIRRRRGMQS